MDIKSIVGSSLNDAHAKAAIENMILRVTWLDGRNLRVSASHQTNRINVKVQSGVVTEIVSIG